MSDTNVTKAELAADMAWGAIKAWALARDDQVSLEKTQIEAVAEVLDTDDKDACELAVDIIRHLIGQDAATAAKIYLRPN